jgi:peptidoglycan/LPS O-acetylase OafA/YrhL
MVEAMNRPLELLVQRKNNNFGVVRLTAAVAVIVSHAFMLSYGSDMADPLAGLTSFLLGDHAVNAFFVLSGFLIAASWHRQPNLPYFLCGRFLRIFPALFLVTVATIVVAGLVQNQLSFAAFLSSWETISLFLRVVVALDGGGTLPGIFVENPDGRLVLATVWTIRYEVICYLTIPLVSIIAFHFADEKKIVSFILLVASVVLILRAEREETLLVDHLARFFFAFYVGVGSWMARRYLSISFWRVGLLLAAAYLLLGTALSPVSEIFAIAGLVFWLGSLDFGRIGAFVSREDISYGLYLLGFPIQQTWLVLWQGPNPVLANMTLTLLTVIPIAFLSWRFVESPMLAQRSALLKMLHFLMPKPIASVLKL